MKRSEINRAVKTARKAWAKHDWVLPPNPKWDVTDFGLGHFKKYGLTIVNLAEQPEYCEKLMFSGKGQTTPMHHHKSKKEDIICRWGKLVVKFESKSGSVKIAVNGEMRKISTRKPLVLHAGERVTLTHGVDHAFWAGSKYAIIGEVSTFNNDVGDNFFKDKRIGRFSEIVEDEKPRVKLVSDCPF